MVNYARFRPDAMHMLPPKGTEIHNTIGIFAATNAPQLLTLFSKLADSGLGSSSQGNSIDSEEVQKNIDDTFSKVKESGFECSTISDVELQLENLVQEKEQINNVTIPNIDNDLNECKNEIQVLESDNSSLKARISVLKNDIDLLSKTSGTEDVRKKLNEELKAAEQLLRNNTDIIVGLNRAIEIANIEKNTATEEIVKIDANINTLKSALADLNLYEAQLKKAEGRDAIEKLSNDETENITEILKKLKTADASKKRNIKTN